MTQTGEILFEALQLAGILAFAISGALVGVRRNLDLLGVIVVGASTGTGGGILRDMLMGVHPPVSFVAWPNLTTAIVGSLVVFFFHPRLSRSRRFEIIFDAFGLGLFSSYGAAVAYAGGTHLLTAILIGTITAIGGGVIRDVLVSTVPGVLTRELYAVSALLGAGIAGSLTALTGNLLLSSTIGGTLAIGLRLTSYKFGWHLPKPRHRAD